MSTDILCNSMINHFPRDIISYILSFNGYEEKNGRYIKKIDLLLYENIKIYFECRTTLFNNYTRTGICILIQSENEKDEDIKVLTINYGYNPVHLLEYENVAPEIQNYNNEPDPFNHAYPLEYVENTEEETMFYSINNYYITDNDNIIFLNSTTYIPQLNAKFEHHPFKEINILNMDENIEEIKEKEEIFNEENYDEEEYYYKNIY